MHQALLDVHLKMTFLSVVVRVGAFHLCPVARFFLSALWDFDVIGPQADIVYFTTAISAHASRLPRDRDCHDGQALLKSWSHRDYQQQRYRHRSQGSGNEKNQGYLRGEGCGQRKRQCPKDAADEDGHSQNIFHRLSCSVLGLLCFELAERISTPPTLATRVGTP